LAKLQAKVWSFGFRLTVYIVNHINTTYGVPAAAVSRQASDFQFLRKTRQLPKK